MVSSRGIAGSVAGTRHARGTRSHRARRPLRRPTNPPRVAKMSRHIAQHSRPRIWIHFRSCVSIFSALQGVVALAQQPRTGTPTTPELGQNKAGNKAPNKPAPDSEPLLEQGFYLDVPRQANCRPGRAALLPQPLLCRVPTARCPAAGCSRAAVPPLPTEPLPFTGLSLDWWRQGGSNPRPQHCERCALPTELCPHKHFGPLPS